MSSETSKSSSSIVAEIENEVIKGITLARQTVMDRMSLSHGDFAVAASEIIATIEDIRASLPESFRPGVVLAVEVSEDPEGGPSFVETYLRWRRPETDAEMRDRLLKDPASRLFTVSLSPEAARAMIDRALSQSDNAASCFARETGSAAQVEQGRQG